MIPAIMIQGTGSHVGKSVLAAGLCRALVNRGLRVRPFKPQNMSNNAGLAALVDQAGSGDDMGEIGRAQVLQAQACRAAPSVDMNPVLLKPQGERSAQVVVQGRAWKNASAADYRALRGELLPRVLDSFNRLARDAEVIVVEGAGSPAEVNLRAGDIANMGFALAARVPVVLAGDIDRGGVLAALIGTWQLLAADERALTGGFIVNKFRGDPALFNDGPAVVTAQTGLPCLGVVPHMAAAARLPAEDSVALDSSSPAFMKKAADASPTRCASNPDASPTRCASNPIRIAVPRLPRLSNFDDLDPLAAESGVELVVVPPGRPLPRDADAVLLAGSKATLADLAALRAEGWDIDIAAHVRSGGAVIGLCGGFQMLGARITDPGGVEGPPGEAKGLGLLDVDTVIGGEKTLRPVAGRMADGGASFSGYEMHMGETAGPGLARPWLALADGTNDGAVSADGRIMGGYVHGLFAAESFRRAFLARLGGDGGGESFAARVDAALDEIAATLEQSLDVDALLALARTRA